MIVLEGTWEEIAAHAPELAGRRVRLIVLTGTDGENSMPMQALKRAPSARELMKLPLEERNRILAAQAVKAESLYRNNPELTDFEAFGEEDLYDETP